eukprot:7951213-Karenia_brevis.AAC.1
MKTSSLSMRIKGLNTSVAEQIYSWFRGYARQLNEMRPLRHQSLVLKFSALHNDAGAKSKCDYLNKFSPFKKSTKKQVSYPCNKKKQQGQRA